MLGIVRHQLRKEREREREREREVERDERQEGVSVPASSPISQELQNLQLHHGEKISIIDAA